MGVLAARVCLVYVGRFCSARLYSLAVEADLSAASMFEVRRIFAGRYVSLAVRLICLRQVYTIR